MNRTFLTVNISDLASPLNIMGFSLLTQGVPKIGYILDNKTITDNLLVLEYSDLERAEAVCELLNKKGIRTHVKSKIKRKILPLNLSTIDYKQGVNSK